MMNRFTMLSLFASLALAINCSAADDFLIPDNWDGLVKEYWKIEGDTVIGKTTEKQTFNTFLCSKKIYADFELSFKVKLVNGNSGIQIRSKIADSKKFSVSGPQADIGAGYWGSLYGELFGGMMKASDAKMVNPILKSGDFNDYSIKVVGKKVTIIVNGLTTVDEEFEKLPATGIIAFQVHSGDPMEVIYKEIKFKELK
jgi:hypothetical protein